MLLTDFARQLHNAQQPGEAETILKAYLSAAGFRYYAFTYYSGHIKTGQKLCYDFVSDALRPWHQYYLEQSYADVDRTLEENFLITLPLEWDVHSQLSQAKNKREQRIREESIEFGIRRGLSLPVHGPQRDFACLTLHECKNENSLQFLAEKQFEWLAATQVYYHHVRRLLNTDRRQQTLLTKREAQCLKLTAEAWRVEQIAKALKISVRTVNFHLQNANKKLGANNKYLAAYQYCFGS